MNVRLQKWGEWRKCGVKFRDQLHGGVILPIMLGKGGCIAKVMDESGTGCVASLKWGRTLLQMFLLRWCLPVSSIISVSPFTRHKDVNLVVDISFIVSRSPLIRSMIQYSHRPLSIVLKTLKKAKPDRSPSIAYAFVLFLHQQMPQESKAK